MNTTSQPSKSKLSRQAQAARTELEQALSFHFQGNKAEALKALRQALKLDPSLAEEKLTSNLAHELTGLPVSSALDNLKDGNSSKTMIDTAQREWRKTPRMRHQRVMLGVLTFLILVFVGLLVWSLRDGTLQGVFGGAQVLSQKYTLDGYEYYVAVPRGSAPKDGWPLVVGFHGYGGNAMQMFPLAGRFNHAGAIFVAPAFGTYEPNPGNGPIDVASRMLIEVGKQYPLQERGAVLLGFSQGGTFAYRFSAYYSSQVAGVVTAGAPELDMILPSRNIPYVFTWGELDELKDYVVPYVHLLQNRGLNARVTIVPDLGHQVSQYAVGQVMLLLGQQ